jgi:hypothetical protein
VRGKSVLEVVFGDVEGKISHKQFIAHMMFYCTRLTVAFSRLFPIIGSKIITELSSPEDSHALKVTSHLTDGHRMAVSNRIASIIRKFLSVRTAPAEPMQTATFESRT